MSDVETLKAEVKKASARAMQAKMDLHDLSEELPEKAAQMKADLGSWLGSSGARMPRPLATAPESRD